MTGRVVTELDYQQSDDIVLSVVDAVSEVSGIDILELPPLYAAVEPGLLDDMLATKGSDGQGGALFTYAGYDVAVSASGNVEVSPIE